MYMKDVFVKFNYMFSAVLLVSIIVGCGGNDDTETNENVATITETRNEIFTPVPGGSIESTPTPVVQDESAAIRHMWVYITECVDIDKGHIKVDRGIGSEWMVMPTDSSSQEFGTWRIVSSGEILPHNSRAELWKKYLGSDCDTNILKPAATDVLTNSDAATLLWTQLAKCNPELPVDALSAQKNRKTGSWVVVSNTSAREDLGVWSVERNAEITPLNKRSEEVWEMLKLAEQKDSGNSYSEASAQCSPVIRSEDDAKRRLWTNLSPCFPNMDASVIQITWDPANHVWVAISKEKGGQNATDTSTSVWHISRNGDMTPTNLSAEATLAVTKSKNC